MSISSERYVETLLQLYLGLPETPNRAHRWDRRLALQLYQRQIPRAVVEAALLLASARRLSRPTQAQPLGPIRSLYYFLPIIEEILQQPPSPSYLQYCRSKLQKSCQLPRSAL